MFYNKLQPLIIVILNITYDESDVHQRMFVTPLCFVKEYSVCGVPMALL